MVLTVIIADDDSAICTVLEQAVRRRGYRALVSDDSARVLEWVQQGKGDVVLTDVLMPKGSGLDMLPALKTLRPELPVIVMSAHNTLLNAVKATELGAFAYLPKPFDLEELFSTLSRALPKNAVSKNTTTKTGASKAATVNPSEATPVPEIAGIIGQSPAMQQVFTLMARLVHNDLTVMLTGESGTGKEVIARAIHALGKRKNAPFVALNMAAIPKDLVESELFGHEKGAFTGAVARRAGAFERAEGGTLFLDEVGDMPLEAQTRLLRVLQEGEYAAIGAAQNKKTRVRIIAATHHALAEKVANGQFREDLFYRLHVVPLALPALRERPSDIPALAQHFLKKAETRGLGHKYLTADAEALLMEYAWPGNVRELENMLYRLVALAPEQEINAEVIRRECPSLAGVRSHAGAAKVSHLSEAVAHHVSHYFAVHGDNLPAPGVYARIMRLVEKPLIEITLKSVRGNQLKAAEILGINRNTLRKKMAELSIRVTEKSLSKDTSKDANKDASKEQPVVSPAHAAPNVPSNHVLSKHALGAAGKRG